MPSKVAFSLKVLLDAVRRRVDDSSIRIVAEEIGMSPSGLHVLLAGSAPRAKTRARLAAWYIEQQKAASPARRAVPAQDVDAAVQLLIHYVAQDGRPDARARRLHEIIRRFEAGVS